MAVARKRGGGHRVGVTPRPFLKWAGGKGQLLAELLARVREVPPFTQYHEPFVGGGALFFELCRTRQLVGKTAWLSDSNQRLIETYLAVKSHVDDVIALLWAHKAAHCTEYYYQVRAAVPAGLAERAARIIYLNKTCFNGLYRENSKGLFNVPIGRYTDPIICDEPNLRAVSIALQHAKVEQRHFSAVLDHVVAGDFVYFDPPYHPLSQTSSFTSYESAGFGEEAQRELAKVYRELDRRGVKVLLSNSWTPLVLELYAGFTIEEVLATRSVNSKADKRGKIAEALVRNF